MSEEKQTDVAMVAQLFQTCIRDTADTVALVTGDTDFAPAIESCKGLFPERHLLFAFPYRRAHDQLRQIGWADEEPAQRMAPFPENLIQNLFAFTLPSSRT